MKGVVAIRPGGPEVLDAAQAPDEGVRPADRVMCLVAGGGNAQRAAVAAANCIPVPDGMSWHDAAAREMTDGRAADVILDLVGANYLPANVRSLARGGRLVLTGLVGGRVGELDMGALIALQGSVLASSLRGRSVQEKGGIMAGFADWALPLFADGTLEPVIDRVLPPAEVAEAHRLSDVVVGKVVLDVPQARAQGRSCAHRACHRRVRRVLA